MRGAASRYGPTRSRIGDNTGEGLGISDLAGRISRANGDSPRRRHSRRKGPMGFRELLAQAKQNIREIDPAGAEPRLGDAQFVDIREQDEYEQGTIPGALFIPRGHLESKVENQLTDKEAPIVLF